jgi:hypothetical protein
MFEDHGRVSPTNETSAKLRSNSCRLGLTKTGQGARIEAFYRSVPTLTIPGMFVVSYLPCFLTFSGGSEDVLLDLGVREALKLHRQAEKSWPKL